MRAFAIAIALAAMIGGFLLLRSAQPPKAPEDDLNVVPGPATEQHARWEAPTGSTTTLISPASNASQSGEDPPAHYAPGAINYAEKGVVPAL